MIEIISNYNAGMRAYSQCHPPTVNSQWQAFKNEFAEFIEQPSIDEAWDILHSWGRLFYHLTKIPCHLLAFPTVYKHSQRFVESGCIRSQRNCTGRCRVQL
ncbi:hypothetical protein IJ00_10570 [Calothrix sp. 336/3]|nr:hypothetical protein IJ00_10570 [Calothrix sp. 336/3]